MRAVVSANVPWSSASYGLQGYQLAKNMLANGHKVLYAANWGLGGGPVTWRGIDVYPTEEFSDPLIWGYYEDFKADALITLIDVQLLDPQLMRRMNTAHWIPIDCHPLGEDNEMQMRVSGATPIAMSQHGARMLREVGFRAHYAPHAIDLDVFKPLPERAQLRAAYGIPEGMFVIGTNGANRDQLRKSFFEQMKAFQLFHDEHPNSLLWIHALKKDPVGIDLDAMARRLGLSQNVRFSDPLKLRAGTITPDMMARWCNILDLYSGPSWAEGFGIPPLEAQACGVPVVVSDATAQAELCGAGWKVRGHATWNDQHRAEWYKPDIDAIYRAYEEAYYIRFNDMDAWLDLGDKAVAFAAPYDEKLVYKQYWKPIFEFLGAS